MERKNKENQTNKTNQANQANQANQTNLNVENLTPERIEQIKTYYKVKIHKIEHFLDTKIGFYWWKKYIAGAFWSNIATPINLSITLITAFTTGQAVTESLIDSKTYSYLSVAALIISTLNTFFRPHIQLKDNIDEMKKWSEFGGRFMNIYNNTDEDLNNDTIIRKHNK